MAFPLILMQCESCSHFFSGFATNPETRYVANEYSYESANSDFSINHFREFAEACIGATKVPARDLSVLDIGSNDGTLLDQFRKMGVNRLVGIDPSPNMAQIAARKEILTEVAFFNLAHTSKLQSLNNGAKYDLIVSANVVNHADDPHQFVETVTEILKDDGIFVFEVPNVVDLIRFRAFETIYHEHVHYWSIESLRELLGVHDFNIFSFQVLDYMCGSVRVYASRSLPECPTLFDLVERDRVSVLRNRRELERFAEDDKAIKLKTLRHLASEKLKGRTIVGIGAATKGNTLLNYFGLTHDIVDFVTDTSIEKIGKITPGSKIPIVSDEVLKRETANTLAILLPWNLDSILRRKFSGSKFEIFTPQIAFREAPMSERQGIYGQA